MIQRGDSKRSNFTMGMMGLLKWLKKDIFRWGSKQSHLDNRSHRSTLMQAFIERRRFANDITFDSFSTNSLLNRTADMSKECTEESDCKCRDCNSIISGVPHVSPSTIVEINVVEGTEDHCFELIKAEWESTRVTLKRASPEFINVIKADLEVLVKIRHPHVLLLIGTTEMKPYGIVSIFEPIICTLYSYLHDEGGRLTIQEIIKYSARLADALRYAHMRGYIHGAVSPYCVYLVSTGDIKLGGWELAMRVRGYDSLQPIEKQYEELLKNEIFRWQPPELFHEREPYPESDIYGLCLLVWEMSTMDIPWDSYKVADLERHSMHWKNGVTVDIYNFPPLLSNLLEIGLQYDIRKRRLDMNTVYRFLMRISLQYENEEPFYLEDYRKNNNSNTFVIPGRKSVIQRNSEIMKDPMFKQLFCSPRSSRQFFDTDNIFRNSNASSSDTQFVQPDNHIVETKAIVHWQENNEPSSNGMKIEEINNSKAKNPSISRNVVYVNDNNDLWRNTYTVKKPSISRNVVYVNDDNHLLRNTYTETELSKENTDTDYSTISSRSDLSNSFQSVNEASQSVSFQSNDTLLSEDARTSVKRLMERNAHKREQFFYGSDSSYTTMDDSYSKSTDISAPVKNTSYEAYKPASHKTSFEPEFNKSGQEFTNVRKEQKPLHPQIPEYIKSAVSHPRILNPDPQSFFATSTWTKAKREAKKNGDSGEHSNHNETYTIDDKSSMNDKRDKENATSVGNPDDLDDSVNSANEWQSTLNKNSDGTVSDFVASSRNEARLSAIARNYCIEFIEDEVEARQSVFEDMYHLNNNDEKEIRSIERSNERGSLLDVPGDRSQQENSHVDSKFDQNPSHSSAENAQNKNGTDENVAKISKKGAYQNKNNEADTSAGSSKEREDRARMVKEHRFNCMVKNNSWRDKCRCKRRKNLLRRRSLPIISASRGSMNSSGKWSICTGELSDCTVEDLYIDDEFDESLNVNLVLMVDDGLYDMYPQTSEL